MAEQESVPKRSWGGLRFWLVLAAALVFFLCGVAIGADYITYHDRIHPGVTISGVDVGGMTKDQATAKIQALVERARVSPITLVGAGGTWTVLPDDVGTTIEVERAVDIAMALTRYDDFFVDMVVRLKLYFQDRNVRLQGSVVDDKMQRLLTRLSWKFNEPPVDSALRVQDGSVSVTEARDGRAVDRSALAERLEALLYTLHDTTIEVPLETVAPTVRPSDHRIALAEAETMIRNPVVLTGGDRSWVITRAELAAWMDFRVTRTAEGVRWAPGLSPARMAPFFDSIADDLRGDPKDAAFANDGSKAWVVAGAYGQALDRAATAQAINETAAEATGRVVAVHLVEVAPSMTTEKAEAMGVKDKLASYTTKYWCPANRRTNVKITTEYATDIFLAPGEEYDFDKRIGPRTPQRGYKLAPGIVADKKLEMVYGGGICQVSTTMFNAAFFAGLEVTERWNHSLYINHYPLGRDATVTDNGKNLRFRNDTGHYLWITGKSDGVTTTITIYGTDEGRKVTYTTRGRGGSYIAVERKVALPDGSLIHDDEFVSVW